MDKSDQAKSRWDLLPMAALRSTVRVLTFGAGKYSPGGWKTVPDARERYFAAMLRHLASWQEGETKDPESGESHLAHAACCLVFLLWFEGADG